MSESQAPNIVEGAMTGDVEDEVQPTAKSAEDRKAAAALSSLDQKDDESASAAKDVDQEAVRQAINQLSGLGKSSSDSKKKEEEKKEVKKIVKVDPADVATVVEQLEMPKLKATEFLRAHDGDVMKALRAYVTAAV